MNNAQMSFADACFKIFLSPDLPGETCKSFKGSGATSNSPVVSVVAATSSTITDRVYSASVAGKPILW